MSDRRSQQDSETAWPCRLTRLDKGLGKFTKLRPGEGRSVVAFFLFALLIMLSYYILKTIREPLLLIDATAETKSYAYAVTALLLLFLIPIYGLVFRHAGKRQLTRWVTGFFLANLLVFFLIGRAGMDVGFAYYVWVGIFSVMITAQFWAFAADTFNVKSGQRLFPLIMVGATLGGLAAPALSGALFPQLGPWNLMLIAMGLLALTLPIVKWSRGMVPPGSRSHTEGDSAEKDDILGGLGLVFSDRYLFLLALLIMLLNWVNTTGEYILTELVIRQAEAVASGIGDFNRGDFIAGFYGSFFSAVNALTLLIQVFVVSWVIRAIGIRGAVLVLPVIAMLGYGMVVFVPVFSIIRVVKVLENATDYSLMNTARHALYLPLTAAKKYEGKTTIETFFWRFGDLAQAGGIYVGLHWFAFGVEQFAMLNFVLALGWLLIAWQIGRMYGQQESREVANTPPRLTRAIESCQIMPGRVFSLQLPDDTFVDPDEGDVMTVTARLSDGSRLPPWLAFDQESLNFRGTAPKDMPEVIELTLRATDFEGAWAEGRLLLHRSAERSVNQ